MSTTTSKTYEVVCVHEAPGYWFGTRYIHTTIPLAPGADPKSACDRLGKGTLNSFEYWEITTTTSTTRSPCVAALSSCAANPTLPGAGSGSVRSFATVIKIAAIGVGVGVGTTYPITTKNRVRLPWPTPQPNPKTGPRTGPSGGPPPPRNDELDNCDCWCISYVDAKQVGKPTHIGLVKKSECLGYSGLVETEDGVYEEQCGCGKGWWEP